MYVVAASGDWGQIVWGSQPAYDFFRGLHEADRAKTIALFKLFARVGTGLRNKTKFKKVQGTELFEFKPTQQIRFLGNFRRRGRFIVAAGTRKKKWKLDREDIDRANRLLDAFDAAQRGVN